MKSRASKLLAAFALPALLATLNSQLSTTFAQGTAFTYQGQLQNMGAPANGSFNLQFLLYTNSAGGTPVAGPVTTNGVIITNGLFTLTMDFGGAVWNGETNWLEIAVETNGGGSFTTLSPRQRVTPTPYAITAENLNGTVSSGDLSGTYGGALNLNNPSDQFTGAFTGDGGGLTNVNAAMLGGLSASSFWQLGGNTAASGSQIVGTLNNQPFDLYADGVRAMRLVLRTDSSGQYSNAPNVIGGSAINGATTAGFVGVTIAGGGGDTSTGAAAPNLVSANFGTISGGFSNSISIGGSEAFIGGGSQNTAGGIGATVAGGIQNSATNGYAMVGGGDGNIAGSVFATIGGGNVNIASGFAGTVGGGVGNLASANYSTVAGGTENSAQAYGSFIGGGGFDGTLVSGNVIDDVAAVIGGGLQNSIPSGGQYGLIGGGAENTVSGYLSAVAGGFGNTVTAKGSFIGGGGFDGSTFQGNTNKANAATIGGGLGNTIPNGSRYAFIGGGVFNIASNYCTTVAGGSNNFAIGQGAFIGGGGTDGNNPATTIAGFPLGNTASGGGDVIGGGYENTASGVDSVVAGGYASFATGDYSTVGGGWNNFATNEFATVAGGWQNSAGGIASFAAGAFANATNNGSFVWSDGSGSTSDTSPDQFVARASGGFFFYTGISAVGAKLAAGATSWTTISDRNAKKNFQPVDTVAVLNKLAAVPVEQWNYKWEQDSDTPNIGPMAQDFKAAFYPGRDDKGISTLEFDGVELAAIQGLNQKVEQLKAELSRRDAENAELKARLEKIEQLINSQKGNPIPHSTRIFGQ